MKNSTYKLIVTCLLLIIVVGGSVLAYRHLQPEPNQDQNVQISTEAPLTMLFKSPDFRVTDRDGNQVSLSDFVGKPVVVNFWASWCGICMDDMPCFQAAYDTYGEDVHFMMVNMYTAFGDSIAAANAAINGPGYTFPVYFDTTSDCAVAFGINAIPVTVFIDADGYLFDSHVGMMTEQILETTIQSLLTN